MAISVSSTGSSNKTNSRLRGGAGTPSTTFSPRKSGAGYTLVEMVVAIAIIILIATIAISYSGNVSRQITLLRAQSQIIGLLNHAKALSQNFRLTPPAGWIICAYGVHVERTGADAGQIFVFQDLVPSDPEDGCTAADNIYSPSNSNERLTGQINNFYLDTGLLEFVTLGEPLDDVVFIPPNLNVLINYPDAEDSGSVAVRVKDLPTASFEIIVNKFAQVTTQ